MSTHPASPAFPTPGHTDPNCGYLDGPSGLTKREHFAALAMQGLNASEHYWQASAETVAQYAVQQADALIAALNKPTA